MGPFRAPRVAGPGRRARGSLLFWPHTWPFVAALAAGLVVLVVLLELGAFSYAYQRLGLGQSSVYLVLLATFVGSAVNVPLASTRRGRRSRGGAASRTWPLT
jgi:uncharacterized membrane protein